MMNELISIIVPVYNVKPYIRKCIDSLVAQTYPLTEIVIVDDASTDGSSEIIEAYARIYSNIIIIKHEYNKGLAAARNTGIRVAKGSFIEFVDSDDYVSPNYTEKLYRNLVSQRVDISVCGRYLEFDTSDGVRLIREEASAFSCKRLSNRETLRALNCYRAFDMSMCSKLIKRELFKDIVFPEGKLCEDFYVCHQLAFKCSASYYDPEPLYYYRQRSGSISRNDKINWAPVDASDKQREFIFENCPDLMWAGITASVFARISIANEHMKRDKVFSKEKEYKKYVKDNLLYVLLNHDITYRKKVQALCYCFSTKLYKSIFLSFSKRARLQSKTNETQQD